MEINMNKFTLLTLSLLMVSPLITASDKPAPAAGGAMSRMGARVTARAQAKADEGRSVQSPTALIDASRMVAASNPNLAEKLREEAVTKIKPQDRVSAAQQKAAPEVAQENMVKAKKLAQQAFISYNSHDKLKAQELWDQAQGCWLIAQLAAVRMVEATPYQLQELLTNSLEQTQGFTIKNNEFEDADNNTSISRFTILEGDNLSTQEDDAVALTTSTASTEAPTAQPAADPKAKQIRLAAAGALAKIGAKKMARRQLDTVAGKYASTTAAWRSAQLVYTNPDQYVTQLLKVMEINKPGSHYQEAAFQLAIHNMRKAGRLAKSAPLTAPTLWTQAKEFSEKVDADRKPALDAMLKNSFDEFITGLDKYND